jgi:hypothetical protein
MESLLELSAYSKMMKGITLFCCFLHLTTLSYLHGFIVSNGRMIMHDELGRMWVEAD